jgi:hypothetical protein
MLPMTAHKKIQGEIAVPNGRGEIGAGVPFASVEALLKAFCPYREFPTIVNLTGATHEER